MTPLLAQGLRMDRSFERIYRRHVGDVYHYALAVMRNPTDAEDVTQTTFLNAYRAYAGGERPRQPQNWLITIAHNVCRQRFRQAERRPREVAYDENLGERLEDDDRGPTAEDLRRALSHLAFNQRAALVMRELEGRSYAEIAGILGLSIAAVETLIFRARRALREQLDGTLTCDAAERALSLEADGRLGRGERGPLRAHLRECAECASAARRQRAHRSAWKALGALPVPASLSALFGGGAAVGVKAAAVAASAIAAGGLGLAGERHFTSHSGATEPYVADRYVAKPQAAKPHRAKPDPAARTPLASIVAPPAAASPRVPVVFRHPAASAAAKAAGRSGGDRDDGGTGSTGQRGAGQTQHDQATQEQDGGGGSRAAHGQQTHHRGDGGGEQGHQSRGDRSETRAGVTRVAESQPAPPQPDGRGDQSHSPAGNGGRGDSGRDRQNAPAQSDMQQTQRPDNSSGHPASSGD
jgi:RNA polymerase sigma factor (sigma-70 family)